MLSVFESLWQEFLLSPESTKLVQKLNKKQIYRLNDINIKCIFVKNDFL